MEREQILYALRADLEAAIKNRDAVSGHFDDVISHVPSGIPYPDNVERIRQASREYTIAQQALMLATDRLNDFLIQWNGCGARA